MNTSNFRQVDKIYHYDGSFDGFLSCVFLSFSHKEIPVDVQSDEQTALSLYPTEQIETNEAHAQRVFQSLPRNIAPRVQDLLTTCFLSGSEEKSYLLLRFLHLGFQEGARVLSMLGHPTVAAVMAMQKNILHEAHQYKGFLRFEEHEGMLGAVIAPKNHVLPLLRHHFTERFPEERFLIYDETHSSVLLYQNYATEIVQLSAPLTLPSPDEKESQYQALWTQFYKTIEIKARHNEQCRRTQCPKRYWAHMTELKNERLPLPANGQTNLQIATQNATHDMLLAKTAYNKREKAAPNN